MDSYRPSDVRSRRLTQLYSNTKHSTVAALPRPAQDDSPEKRSLDRKFSLLKDRLIAWGFDWSDNHQGEIDKSLEAAGLTEVVESILTNIKSIIEDVERMNAAPATSPYPVEKAGPSWTAQDYNRYGDLVQDMTTAIDLLCDLSKSRRGKSHSPTKKKRSSLEMERPTTPVPAYDHDLREAMPSSHGIPKIDASLFALPQEGPPGYVDPHFAVYGMATSPRLFGHLRRSSGEPNFIPVMVEYAHFDRLYKDTDMDLPMTRLEQLHAILRTWESSTSNALSRPMAYFEDPVHARYGLVFELPYASHVRQTPSVFSSQPTNLATLLHQASRAPQSSTSSNLPWQPPLEDRFRLAQQLLRGFQFLQEHEFSHRNINSSNIAILATTIDGQSGGYDVRHPLICSIDLFSEFDVDPSPENLQQNIYRHPDDPRIRGPNASPEYELRFDLYSLSLVLLEIGTWHPLADLYKEKYSLRDFKTRVEKVWIRRLAARCGTAYTRCVEELFAAGNRPQQDAASISRLLSRVSARLDRCCAIDLEEADAEDFDTEEEQYGGNLVAEPTSLDDTRSRPAKRLLFQDLELPQEVLAKYHMFESQVVRITEKILRASKESCWIDLLYSGETKETARPTICVGCSSTKMVRSALRKHLRYDRNLFDLAVFKDTVQRSMESFRTTDEPAPRNPGHQMRPVCGASIGAWRYGEHSPAVSFGGVVMIDDQPYGMTCHHLLEDEAEQDPPPQSFVDGVAALDLSDDEDDGSDDGSMADDAPSLVDDDSDDEPEPEFTFGFRGEQAKSIVLTQPALSDVEPGFFPSKEDEDDEHLLSHRLGHVYASSGLRQTQLGDGFKHEIDWLLMKLPYNLVAGGKQYCPEDALFAFRPKLLEPVARQYPERDDLYPRRIADSAALPGLPVHSFGRTSGLAAGTISHAMRWVRFNGRQSFSQVWTVNGGQFGVGGDSGAWIVDNYEGRVCGHVLAWSSRFGVAYMAPMDVMIDDMMRALGAREISLPGATEQARPLSAGRIDLSGLDLDDVELPAFAAPGFAPPGHMPMDLHDHKLARSSAVGGLLGRGPRRSLRAAHSLLSGNPTRMEREWLSRRERLGMQLVPGGYSYT